MSKANGKTRLTDSDWKALFPGEEYKIGSTSIRIKPLGLEGLSIVIDKISKIIDVIQSKNINFENVMTGDNPAKFIDVIHLVVIEAPEILSEMSQLHEDDVKSLPIEKAVDLFNKCLEVNIESQESLRKNFQLLGTRLTQFLSAGASEA